MMVSHNTTRRHNPEDGDLNHVRIGLRGRLRILNIPQTVDDIRHNCDVAVRMSVWKMLQSRFKPYPSLYTYATHTFSRFNNLWLQ
jgi:hypothetical protein